MPQTIDLNLTRGAVRLLASALVQGGWYSEKDQTAQVYRAGQILDLPEMDQPDAPAQDAPVEVAKAWANAPVVLPLTEKQREAAKACVAYFITKGALPAGKPLMVLMRALGLAPED